MGAVGLLIGAGIILIVASPMWLLLNDPVNQVWEDYGLGEAPFELMYMGWNVSGTVVLILIGIALIAAGAALSRREHT